MLPSTLSGGEIIAINDLAPYTSDNSSSIIWESDCSSNCGSLASSPGSTSSGYLPCDDASFLSVQLVPDSDSIIFCNDERSLNSINRFVPYDTCSTPNYLSDMSATAVPTDWCMDNLQSSSEKHWSSEQQEQDFDTSMEDKLDLVSKLAMEEGSQSIVDACEHLLIASDPRQWDANDVQKWVRWALEHYDLPDLPITLFNMNGSALCQLSVEDFQSMLPHSSEQLYGALDIWKNTCCNQKLERLQQSMLRDNLVDANHPTVLLDNHVLDQINSFAIDDNNYVEQKAAASPAVSTTSSFCSDDESKPYCLPPSAGPSSHGNRTQIQLWQFLKELLANSNYINFIKYLKKEDGVFKIENSVEVAKLWGRRKNRPAMNYDKLSRSLRQYYKKNILKKPKNPQRLVYQFCPKYRS